MQRDLYHAVEHAAIARFIPRIDLWKRAARAIVNGELPVTYPEPQRYVGNPNRQVLPQSLSNRNPTLNSDGSINWPVWMQEFLKAVIRDKDPSFSGFPAFLRCIKVDAVKFDAWLLKTTEAPRGPRRGTSGFTVADRNHFETIDRLIESGDARSPSGAALKLAREGKIKGASPESAAKRVAALYKRERQG